MPSPTREDIIEAHKALTNLLKLASGTSTASAIFNEKIVRDALPPKPLPTMAEVEWDGELHYLAEAERVDGVKVAMLKPMRLYPQIKCLAFDGGDFCIVYPDPESLTPTGKRYTLTEVQE